MDVRDYIKQQIDKAQARKLRRDLVSGKYVAALLGLTYETRQGREKLGKCLWIDFVIDDNQAVGSATPNDVGEVLAFPIPLSGQYVDLNFADVKNFLIALTGCSADEASTKWGELVDAVNDEGKHSQPRQPARGMRITIETVDRAIKTGKNAGKVRTYPRWFRFEQSSQEIADRRSELDAAA